MAKDPDTLWKATIAALPAGSKRPSSTARLRVKTAFAEIAAAKARGVTWQRITDAFTADGIVGADGAPLTVDAVRSLFNAERYARGERPKRKAPKTPAPVAPVAPPEPQDFPFEQGDRPRRKFGTVLNPRHPKED
jgi:hypothetical protein